MTYILQKCSLNTAAESAWPIRGHRGEKNWAHWIFVRGVLRRRQFADALRAAPKNTAWLANYITQCPNGPGSMMFPLDAMWWPAGYGMLMPVQANNGVFDDVVNVNGAMGTVHLVRQ